MADLDETGIVVEVDGSKAKIAIERSEACNKCGACRLAERGQQMILTVDNAIQAKTGDRVTIDLKASSLLSATFIIYVLPLAALLLGVALGYWIADAVNMPRNGDIYGAIGGIALAALSFGIIRLLEPRISKSRRYIPAIKRIVYENEDKGSVK